MDVPISIRHVLHTIRQRAILVAVLPAIAGACACAAVWVMPNQYMASVLLQIDPQRQTPERKTLGGSAQIDPQTSDDGALIAREIEFMKSRPVIRKAVESLGLYGDAEFAPPGLLARLKRPAIGASAGRLESPSLEKDEVVRGVLDRLEIRRVRNTFLIEVRFSSTDADKAARIANALGELYLKEQVDAKVGTASAVSQLLQQKIDDTRRSLADVEQTLAQGKTGGLATGDAEQFRARKLLFETVLARYVKTAGTLSFKLPNSRIVTPAIAPQKPTSPKRILIVVLVLGGALASSIALAMFLEARGPRKTRAAHVELDIPRLAFIPRIESGAIDLAPAKALRFVVAEPSGRFSDAIRAARRELDVRHKAQGARVILVASSTRDEGATIFASNLAHHFAMSGASSLLVDADFENQPLTRQLAKGCTAGLIDQIASQQPAQAAILRDCVTRLLFLPACGPEAPAMSGGDICGSQGMADAIAELKVDFDTIIVSAPPLLPVADGRILANLADQIVLVMASHALSEAAACKALQLLDGNATKVAGVVTTDITAYLDRLDHPAIDPPSSPTGDGSNSTMRARQAA
jgi:Mrp family chromosome partitioning ATPase/capsular polysaccharide biosynthesis protein